MTNTYGITLEARAVLPLGVLLQSKGLDEVCFPCQLNKKQESVKGNKEISNTTVNRINIEKLLQRGKADLEGRFRKRKPSFSLRAAVLFSLLLFCFYLVLALF